MAVQRRTREIIEAAVSKREKFVRGNVSGKWVDQLLHSWSTGSIGEMPKSFAEVFNEHQRSSKLYVLYSYNTPMAWYVENTGKWYYVDHKYSMSTSGHQHAYRYVLKGENVVTLTRIFDNDENGYEVAEMEKEYY